MPLDKAKLTYKDEYVSNSETKLPFLLQYMNATVETWSHWTLNYFQQKLLDRKLLSCWQERCWVKETETLLILFSSKNRNESLSSNTKEKCIHMECEPDSEILSISESDWLCLSIDSRNIVGEEKDRLPQTLILPAVCRRILVFLLS